MVDGNLKCRYNYFKIKYFQGFLNGQNIKNFIGEVFTSIIHLHECNCAGRFMTEQINYSSFLAVGGDYCILLRLYGDDYRVMVPNSGQLKGLQGVQHGSRAPELAFQALTRYF